ncbi:MAG: MogA/MoaB family molybdenum cofactor biosynthesis protein, partial [Chloroflexota bacterium]|nr:MogA/MoaB family molybdenum cofactor biosynthesis protein [Chloroflexota bacterium]
MIRGAILTISDKASRGEREDLAGPAIRDALRDLDVAWVEYRVVPDEQARIAAALVELSDRPDLDALFTTGGTGLAPRDVTPQATLSVVEYEVPGIAEVMRAESVRVTPAGMLSRAVAGVRNGTLIV